MAVNAANTTHLAGWSGELKDLQDETVRLLHNIRADNGSQSQQQPSRQVSQGGGKDRKGGEASTTTEITTSRADRKSHRRRQKKRRARKNIDVSKRHENTGLGSSGPKRFSHTLDTTGWLRKDSGSGIPASTRGWEKTTVEVLDRGEETPRSPPLSESLAGVEFHQGSNAIPRKESSSTTPRASKNNDMSSTVEDEGRFRLLSFKEEENRVRDGTDTYLPDTSSLGDGLQRLRAERDRLANIEEAQRETCRGEKRQEFVRFARRKWLASDRAAEIIQRVFRGCISRRRAGLAREIRRLVGEAGAEWVEVRDHNRGEAWYFNPLTGKSQWNRPESLLGTITPSEKVKTLPALGSPLPSKQRSLRKHVKSNGGTFDEVLAGGGKEALSDDASSTSRLSRSSALGPGSSGQSVTGTAAPTAVADKTTTSRIDHGVRAQTAPSLPPLMNGGRHSTLPSSSTTCVAPSCGPGGELRVDQWGGVETKKQRDKQQAWVEEEDFPFLTDDDVLPDDRHEETGLGLARRVEEEGGYGSSDDTDGDAIGAGGFFLADGAPNIHLRRTIAKALKVSKFDSVSTLLADYTGRNTAASTTLSSNQKPRTSRAAVSNTSTRRAATAISGGIGSRMTRKRSRSSNPLGVTGNLKAGGGTNVNSDGPYPTGKLLDDKNPSLFASAAAGSGRKMVSVMTTAGESKRAGLDRRVKTAGTSGAEERGSALKGLAIRDLTSPGFLPPSEMGPDRRQLSAVGSVGGVGTHNSAGGDTGDTQGAQNMEVRSVGGEDEGGRRPSTDVVGRVEHKVKQICFNCWSKGDGKACTLHTGGTVEGLGGKAAGEARLAESTLMCKNWDVGVLRRRYRSEEIQEVFAKEASSLKYNKERKTFISIVEQRHPIYRLLAKIIAGYNFTVRRKLHQKHWMRGFAEQLRMGKLLGISPERVGRTARLLRLRNTLKNSAQVRAFTKIAQATQPRAPMTGTTLPECLGFVRVLVDRPSSVMGRVTKVVIDGPTPLPQALFEARRYYLPPPKTMPMPEPKYLDMDAEDDRGEIPERVHGEEEGGIIKQRAAWVQLFCWATAGDIVRSAATNVEIMSPIPGADEITRTKYPPALTIKFATFSRKPTAGMLAVGGLPAEMVVHMLVSTRIPPQYGNFTVMQKSSVAPTVSKEKSADYESLELPMENQAFLPRALQHPLNARRAPAVTVKTLMEDPSNRHYFGLNRPEQTGEAESHGFRTSAHADTTSTIGTLDPSAFTPSEEVVTANLCSANRTVTTHVDRSYPFCEPSNRSNTTLDFYHLLLTATCSPNKEQVFTNLGVQECGEFMRGSDSMRPMGHCIGVVYRSWAFLQKQVLEEFETDDGVPYWFDRRTGETFWERPLCKEEKVPIKEGGTILGGQGEAPDSSSGAFEDIKPRYDQQQMRKLMMKSHEGTDVLQKRRKQVATQVKWARSSGALPPPDPSDLEPPTPDSDADSILDPEENESIASPDGIDQSPGGKSPRSRKNDVRNGRQERGAQGGRGGEGGNRGRGDGGKKGPGWGSTAVVNGSKVDRLVVSIAQALNNADLNDGCPVKPSDMLRFGMGLGLTLGANGLLTEFGGEGGDAQGGGDTTGGVEASLAPAVVKTLSNGHPIGHGHAKPIAEKQESNVLDHKSEAEHLASIVRDSADLKTSEEFKGLLIVRPPEVTPCPDEDYGVTRPEDMEDDPRRKIELTTPIIAYPETLWKKQYRGHAAAGEGQSWLPAGGDRAGNQRAKTSQGVQMRRTNEPLPEGFLNAISHTHVGEQHCDYLPHVPNMPQAKTVGRVRPRSAAEDWFAVGFDPWSAGREPLTAEFISTLSIKQEDLGGDDDGGGASTVPQAGYLELKDSAGHAEMAIVSAEEAKLAANFEQISSWARHSRYADIETTMNQADWTMPIDYQNDLGLTLLHVAVQNGNKRIAKLCLRKGADVNKRNNNGQTPLHYAYSFGFESFGEYLISKGADDSIINADGLTCYEGLSQNNLGQL